MSNIVDKYKAVDAPLTGESEAIRAKMENVKAAKDSLSAKPEPAKPSTPTETSPKDRINPTARYGDRPSEKRIDVSGMTKPLGTPTYHKGVASVPKTGPAILKKGEKVVPAEHNPDNPDNKNAVEQAVEHTPSEKEHFHRAMSHLHKGALHRHLGIAEGEPIPMEQKQEAANSDNPHVSAMGRLALAMHGWKHKK